MSASPTMPRCPSSATRALVLLVILQFVFMTYAMQPRRHKYELSSLQRRDIPAPKLKNTSYTFRKPSNKKNPNKRRHNRGQVLPARLPSSTREPLVEQELLQRKADSQQIAESIEMSPDYLVTKEIRINQIKHNILEQLNMKTAPNVTGVIESSNPIIQQMINGVHKSNSKMPHDSPYQQDMPEEINNQKILIPVEKSKYIIIMAHHKCMNNIFVSFTCMKIVRNKCEWIV